MSNELGLEVIIHKSKTPSIWISRCPRLNLCTQGESEEQALEAIIEVIAFELLQPSDAERVEGASKIQVPLNVIAQEANRLATTTVRVIPREARFKE